MRNSTQEVPIYTAHIITFSRSHASGSRLFVSRKWTHNLTKVACHGRSGSLVCRLPNEPNKCFVFNLSPKVSLAVYQLDPRETDKFWQSIANYETRPVSAWLSIYLPTIWFRRFGTCGNHSKIAADGQIATSPGTSSTMPGFWRKRLGDRVTVWAAFNMPWTVAYLG
jgi:hypothetical protein